MVKTKLSASKRSWSFELMMVPYIVIVIALLAIGGQLWVMRSRMAKLIPSNTYQAVFLTNGQVYFGHLRSLNAEYMVLSDVYYLQQSTDSATTAEADSKNTNTNESATEDVEFKIIRLGEEIHQPQNGLVISRDHMLYWENLTTSSRIIEAIGKDKEASK